MKHPFDLFDLECLYETARGFLERRERDTSLRFALLSLMGLCGVSSAAYFEAEDRNEFSFRIARGAYSGDEARIRLNPRLRRHWLENDGAPVLAEHELLDARMRDWMTRRGFGAAVPVIQEEEVRGVLLLGRKLLGEEPHAHDLGLAREIAELLVRAQDAGPEARPRRPTTRTTAQTADALRERYPALGAIQGRSAATAQLLDELVALAEFEHPILVIGETGTGKELVARALHQLSPRSGQSFEAINCAAIPAGLIESALFGHERGAFTGAMTTAHGAFERAGRGTIFLDEIGDMNLEAQASLLRVLQERRFRRVGGDKEWPAEARVVSATNRDLGQAVADGRFRADLFYRLQMYSLSLAPLRERREDIEPLVLHFLERHRGTKQSIRPGRDFLEALKGRALTGNVRELEGLVLAAVVRARGESFLRATHLPREPLVAPAGDHNEPLRVPVGSSIGFADRTDSTPATRAARQGSGNPNQAEHIPRYAEMEGEYIRSVLRLTDGNKKEAAALMGIPRTTLNARMRKLGL